MIYLATYLIEDERGVLEIYYMDEKNLIVE